MPHPTELADALVSTLRALHLAGRRVALVGYPSYDNIGDHAIWCGQITLLQHLGCQIVASADTQEYSPGIIRRRLGASGALLLTGGGNFGDLWPEHHELRLRVLGDFGPTHQIVQLPQTLHFTRQSTLARTAEAIAAAQQLTILCRDKRSVSIARDELHASAHLTPDAAFGMALERPRPWTPQRDVLWLRRLDEERATEPLEPPAGALADHSVRVIDWCDVSIPAPGPRALTQQRWRSNQLRATRLTCRRGTGDLAQPLLRRLHDASSTREVSAGLAEIAAARVVVTDRLHVHILATLAGVPNVVVDTGYGKLNTFIDTFTADVPTTHRARSAVEAGAIAERLLTRQLTTTTGAINSAPGS